MSPEDLFNKWLSSLRGEGEDRYSHNKREEYLMLLADIFYNSGVSFEDAKTFRNSAMINLTTVEGRKNKGKYKGWKDNCLRDFDIIMADYYVGNDLVSDDGYRRNDTIIGNGYYTEIHQDIKKWVDEKYYGNKDVLDMAHTVGSAFNFEFIKDTYG